MLKYENICIYGVQVNIINKKPTKQLQIIDDKGSIEPDSPVLKRIIKYLNSEAFSYIANKENIQLEIFRPR